MSDSTLARSRRKAAKPKADKPRPDFPLFCHKGSGYWAKKVRGKLEYFGKKASDPNGQAALALWLKHKDNLLAGRKRRDDDGGFTVEDLCDHFLNAKKPLVASRELTQRMYDEYLATCKRVVKAFGLRRLVDDLRPEDFDKLRASAAAQWGLHRVAGEVQRVRTVFKYGFDAGHIDRPVKFGPTFKKPSKAVFRKAKAAKGESLLGAAEIGKLLVAAGPQMRAMILLGLNCAFGNADCGQLHFRALDLKAGWVTFARGKTGIERRCPLWPETIEALTAAIAARPTPKDEAHRQLVFVTKYGKSWFKETLENPITSAFRKLLDATGLHTPGKGFYWLRHTFETIGGESADQVAVDSVMGHADESMGATYRERINDARLIAVASHVRGYIFPTCDHAAGQGGAK